ncbi:unnamed protein product, partial [Mesorhabditis belari]|uniref:Uncharacterized protein n=1 Tax=Mesorhabditis belari TaxID=2138241 RepID=A0AAF3EUX3_9BILA
MTHWRVFIFIFFIHLVHPCPQAVLTLCRCEDLHNGVSLDCSKSDAFNVVQILRANQAHLGLIQSLNLQEANLRLIPASFFDGLYIKRLDLSHNNIESFDKNAFAGVKPIMQDLFVHHNNLSTVPVSALQSLKTLLRLDLSNNSIVDLGAESALPALPKLMELNLGSNRIMSIHKTTFENIKNSVQSINLGHNNLTTVPASAIRGFKLLQALHIHHNHITALDNLVFMNLPVLNLLNLASNNISEIRPQAFLNVPNLRYLYLTDNQIINVDSQQFAAFDHLEMLDMTNNHIEKISRNSFSNLPELRQLYLGSNRIEEIEQDAFANSSIAILILANNKLTKINAGQFRFLPNIQQISFKNNQISSINPNAFFEIPSLVMIDLSQNSLTELPVSVFESQLGLLLIDLSKNQIIRTPYSAFNRRVGTVLLQENPLVCTEKVHMIQDGVGVYVSDSEDLVCGGTPKAPHKIIISSTQKPKESEQSSFLQETKISLKSASNPSIEPAEEVQERSRSDFRNNNQIRKHPISAHPIPTHENVPNRPMNSLNMMPPMLVNGVERNTQRNHVHEEIDEPMEEPKEEEGQREELPAQTHQYHSTDASQQEPERAEEPEQPIRTTPVPKLPRRYTDIADNPNIIHPFPVPFLKRGPNMSKSSRVTFDHENKTMIVTGDDMNRTIIAIPTLPPSIILHRRIPNNPEINQNKVEDKRIEQFPLAPVMSKEVSTEHPYELEGSEKGSWSRLTSPTTIITICLSVVALVMVTVFVGLCIAKHRNIQRLESSCSNSTTQRTNAYVAEQAHMNMIYGGTTERRRSIEHSQPWIYTPGPAYQHYYK